jgi:hypothetical protein
MIEPGDLKVWNGIVIENWPEMLLPVVTLDS